ncbi:YusW family protein [Siminovitchia sediminis]|uniref:YusW family protein n=1 Tax=Siminovitchia sediminis TaxID=1274353 RepID=A0ABW4KJG4_9BACI
MRQVVYLTAVLWLAFTLAACGTSNNDTENTQGTDVSNNEGQVDHNADDQDNIHSDDTATNHNNTNDSATSKNVVSEESQAKMDALNYTDFELSVEYDGGQEFEASLENDQNRGVEAELEDEINDLRVNGQEAFNNIFPNVEKLTVDGQTSKEDAIQHALDAFSLESNYKKFELELTFKDGSRAEFEDKK